MQSRPPRAEPEGGDHQTGEAEHLLGLDQALALDAAERIDAREGSLNTEGAIAKYLATEAGNAAADAAIQAHGGYGYTHEYMVEKIRRDVRITTIYEGTSEIMEMTIARDRWQQHLKTRGDHYHAIARELEGLDARNPAAGAGIAALALHALAEVLEAARVGRLTRNQHVLLRIGGLAAQAEGAAALARRAGRAASGDLPEKASRRFDPAAVAAIARVNARDVALTLATDGLRWIAGAGPAAEDGSAALASRLRLAEIHSAQAGLVADMDEVADAVYGRASGGAA
ncbi:MAG: acyl-CoA dehydrogenase family protein [Solirubrobacterales bacterium]